MRSLKAAFKQASEDNAGFVRTLLASLAKEAGKLEDAFARASYIEGVTGSSPGVYARNAKRALADLYDDLVNEKDNRIITLLRYKKGVSEKDLHRLLGDGDLKLFEALKAGAASGMGSGSVRGLDAEDVAMAIAMGMSPLTGGPLRYGKGKNVFYHLGKSAGNKITIGGLASILKAEGKNRAIDILRGTNEAELGALDLYAPAFRDEGDGSMTLGEMIEAPTEYRASYVDLLDAIFTDKSIISIIDQEIFPLLKGEVQRKVWSAIKANPDLLNLRQGKVTVRNKELAEALGGEASPQAAGKLFQQKVWPMIEAVLTNSEVTKKLVRKRHILEIIQEAQRNRGQDKTRTRGIGIKGLPEPEKKGPVRMVHGPFKLELPRQGPQPHPGTGKRMPKYSAQRVVSKYIEYVNAREAASISGDNISDREAQKIYDMWDSKNRQVVRLRRSQGSDWYKQFVMDKATGNAYKIDGSWGGGIMVEMVGTFDSVGEAKSSVKKMAAPAAPSSPGSAGSMSSSQAQTTGAGGIDSKPPKPGKKGPGLKVLEGEPLFDKKAWRLPAKEARLYKKMKDWASENWQMFSNDRGRINFDKFADTLASKFGGSWMAEEPEHWVWEIVYDVGRLKPSY